MEMIYPDLQAAVLCEDVRNEASGQHTLVGIISAIPTPTAPVGFFKLCLWTRWTGGNGTFTQHSHILNAEDEKPLISAEVRFTLNNLESHATNVNVFGGVQFPAFGLYHAEVHLEGDLKLRFSFPVVRVNPPNANQGGIPGIPGSPRG
jgi:hypothetical protein